MNESSVPVEISALPAHEDITLDEIYSDPRIEVNYVSKDLRIDNDGVKNYTNDSYRNPARDVGGKGGGKVRGIILTPTRTRSSGGIKQSSIRFLEKKNERWYEIRTKELALENKKQDIEAAEKIKRLEIDERRFRLEERKLTIEEARMEMAEKRFKAELDIFKNQQRLMEVTFMNYNKNNV